MVRLTPRIDVGCAVRQSSAKWTGVALSQFCDLRVSAHLCLHGPEPAVSCRHRSVMWVVGHTSPTYRRYLPGI